MKVSHGVAYGSLGGYGATMDEGSGNKRICFTLLFPDGTSKSSFSDEINGTELQNTYHIRKLDIGPRYIEIVFRDTIGIIAKVRAFLDWFLPVLQRYGASPADVCIECGTEVSGGTWGLINGMAYHFHDSCADRIKQDIAADNQQMLEDDQGSYLTGALGALGGSLLGAIVWAVVLSLGYMASLVGLLIGWLSEKGYRLLHGKQGKAKVLILILAIIFGVVLGTLAADAYTLFSMIQRGELPLIKVGDIPQLIITMLRIDSAYLRATVINILVGLLFAGLGVLALLMKTRREVAGVTFIDLP